MNSKSCTIAAVQTAPIFLDRKKTIEKACDLISAAGKNGAGVIVFPEAFIPAYPDWVWVLPPNENKIMADLYARLLSESVTIPGDELQPLCRAAKSAKAYVVMGVSERNIDGSGTSLYNTLVYIDDSGTIVGKHRKLVPTAPERMVWAPGDGSTLDVFETPYGRLGGLICWENYMPLARYTMYAGGTQLYVAPTWDNGEPWLSTLRHIAKEGRVSVVGCCIAMKLSDIDDGYGFKKYYTKKDEWINTGDSAIVNPDGKFIAGPLNRAEGIIYAEIDAAQSAGLRWKLDVAGHYARPDVFELNINRAPQHVINERKNEKAGN